MAGQDMSNKQNSKTAKTGIYTLFLTTTVLFATLSVIFLQSLDDAVSIPFPRLFGWNTLLLLASSLAFQWGWAGREEDRLRPALQLTFGCGTIFLVLQILAWYEFYQQLTALNQLGTAAAFLYLLSGLHAVHLLVALACMLYGLLSLPRNMVFVEHTLYVWHFLGVLWIYLLLLLWWAI